VTIPFPLSRILGCFAEGIAAEMRLAVAIAIVDHEGLLQYFARMEGTLPASTEIAMAKAYTAAALRMSTREVGQMALPGEPLYGIQHTHGGRIVLFGGGFPLKLQGQVAGGIGISGGSVEEDEQVAKPVLDILAEMESLAEWIKPFFLENIKGTGWMHWLEENLEQGFLKVGCVVPHDFISIFAGAFIIAADGH
jgi:uncharacterized protein GlcG (DUF336 family)